MSALSSSNDPGASKDSGTSSNNTQRESGPIAAIDSIIRILDTMQRTTGLRDSDAIREHASRHAEIIKGILLDEDLKPYWNREFERYLYGRRFVFQLVQTTPLTRTADTSYSCFVYFDGEEPHVSDLLLMKGWDGSVPGDLSRNGTGWFKGVIKNLITLKNSINSLEF